MSGFCKAQTSFLKMGSRKEKGERRGEGERGGAAAYIQHNQGQDRRQVQGATDGRDQAPEEV